MSYSRFGCDDSDVYLFSDTDGLWNCCGCWLDGDYRTEHVEAFLHHLDRHKAAGHNVPQSALERIRDEIAAGVAEGETQ